eukprot:GHVR01172074.1.p1 GENE.GHVR01172074.1~~GHVR01172074.1.p1  ORF type:complete len:200 (-),score=31.36 GHVR01172074.1:143-742(-)
MYKTKDLAIHHLLRWCSLFGTPRTLHTYSPKQASLRGEIGIYGGPKSPHECVVVVRRNNRWCVLRVHPVHVKLSQAVDRGCVLSDHVGNDSVHRDLSVSQVNQEHITKNNFLFPSHISPRKSTIQAPPSASHERADPNPPVLDLTSASLKTDPPHHTHTFPQLPPHIDSVLERVNIRTPTACDPDGPVEDNLFRERGHL